MPKSQFFRTPPINLASLKYESYLDGDIYGDKLIFVEPGSNISSKNHPETLAVTSDQVQIPSPFIVQIIKPRETVYYSYICEFTNYYKFFHENKVNHFKMNHFRQHFKNFAL